MGQHNLIKSSLFATAVLVGAFACSQVLQGTDNPPIPDAAWPAIQYFKQNSTISWRKFDTLHEAAVYGAERLEKCSRYYECSGYIVTDKDGKFLMSPVRTDYASDHVRVSEKKPDGTTRVADIHSHPCVPEHVTGKFSPEDMIESITTRTTAYMVDQCTGDVHEFVPGVSKPDDVYDSDAELWLSAGNIIGKVAAYDELKADVGL